MHSTHALRPKLRKILRDLMISVPDDDTDLVVTGALDSLSLVNLIMELETQFVLTIDFDTLELESFRTVNAMSNYLAASLSKKDSTYLTTPTFPLKPQNTAHVALQKP